MASNFTFFRLTSLVTRLYLASCFGDILPRTVCVSRRPHFCSAEWALPQKGPSAQQRDRTYNLHLAKDAFFLFILGGREPECASSKIISR